MTAADLERQRILSENTLMDGAYDFTAKYLAVYFLQSLVETNPEVIRRQTISILQKVLTDYEFRHQTQAYFMYKEVANTLCAIIIHSKHLAEAALDTLKNLLLETEGHPHRAAAEALGSLPFSVRGPRISASTQKLTPGVTWEQIIHETGLDVTGRPRLVGRSLVARLSDGDHHLVVKLARAGESPEALVHESLWMEYLQDQSRRFSVRFNVPVAVRIKGSRLFRMHCLPTERPDKDPLHPKGYAIGFIADKEYFSYPNESEKEKRLTSEEFRDVISRNAWLLGKLTSMGIVHSAPIPLFHNRVQRQRRRDRGLYEWPRAGRLDRWLESCMYPNLGVTGIRDFEHFISFRGGSHVLYRHIGIHMLSLMLILGSYFRNKDGRRVGFDSNGRPVDARDLFDKKQLKVLITEIFRSYYRGFVANDFEGNLPIDLDRLASRMIDEMGVDRYMEEVLRVADQNQMTNEEFEAFLRKRRFSAEKIKSLRKGAGDIVINSGPHLGEFNHHISLPELIEAVGTMSCLCIAGRYCNSDTDTRRRSCEGTQEPHR